jgi:hypothetical protein
MDNQQHLPIAKLIAVMMHQAPLTEYESDHLSHCRECQHAMAEAVTKEIGALEDGVEGA